MIIAVISGEEEGLKALVKEPKSYLPGLCYFSTKTFKYIISFNLFIVKYANISILRKNNFKIPVDTPPSSTINFFKRLEANKISHIKLGPV